MKIIMGSILGLITLLMGTKQEMFFIPDSWPKPEYNFSNNELNPSKVLLGKVLFYDNRLSQNKTISCANCHSPYSSFTHVDHALSHGINDRIGTRNAPALINLAWQKSFMWDGAVNNLDMQALAPLTGHNEMGNSLQSIVDTLNNSLFYRKLYYEAFSDSLITGERTLKAISSFLLCLISSQSKYDSVRSHLSSFTFQEKNGYQLFIKNCSNCHQEPLFTNQKFENNGLLIDSSLNDFGRIKLTHDANDSLKFKVPTLRRAE